MDAVELAMAAEAVAVPVDDMVMSMVEAGK